LPERKLRTTGIFSLPFVPGIVIRHEFGREMTYGNPAAVKFILSLLSPAFPVFFGVAIKIISFNGNFTD